jgi:hypothetical protein
METVDESMGEFSIKVDSEKRPALGTGSGQPLAERSRWRREVE